MRPATFSRQKPMAPVPKTGARRPRSRSSSRPTACFAGKQGPGSHRRSARQPHDLHRQAETPPPRSSWKPVFPKPPPTFPDLAPDSWQHFLCVESAKHRHRRDHPRPRPDPHPRSPHHLHPALTSRPSRDVHRDPCAGLCPTQGTPMLILASASPRRRELLTQAGFVFTVEPAHIDENSPARGARRGLRAAARGRKKPRPSALSTAATPGPSRCSPPTLPSCCPAISSSVKPDSPAEAARMLALLFGPHARRHDRASPPSRPPPGKPPLRRRRNHPGDHET